MARRSRGKRRRKAARERRAEGPVDPSHMPDGFYKSEEEIAEIKAKLNKARDDHQLSDNDLDPRDDLADTRGEKGRGRMPDADRYISARTPADHVTYEVHIPKRFAIWLDNYAKIHGTTPSNVFDFAMRQIWKEDDSRQMGNSMQKDAWKEIAPQVA